MRWLAVILVWLASLAVAPAFAQEKVGVVLMHGKQGGGPGDSSLDTLHGKLLAAGLVVARPEMPWSHRRYIEGDWNLAMTEIGAHVRRLRASGVEKIALVGHSLGSPAALAFAARHPGQVDALALLAPGHVPHYYSLCLPYSPLRMCGVRDSVEQARREVEAGNGDRRQAHVDINQGRRGPVWMTPRDYLSYFDPASEAEMAVAAGRLGADVPVLWVIGSGDYLIREGRAYVFDRLPPNPRSQYLEVNANHFTTPAVASEQVVQWLRAATGGSPAPVKPGP